MKSERPVLLVEDDSVDAMAVKRAFREIHMANPLQIVENGEEALDYLRDPANPRPCIILLDLNMPRMGGIEFLRVAKADASLRRIPVVVLTTSRHEEDKVESFDLSVAGYMLKPVDYKKFVDVVRAIEIYWTLSELPEDA